MLKSDALLISDRRQNDSKAGVLAAVHNEVLSILYSCYDTTSLSVCTWYRF